MSYVLMSVSDKERIVPFAQGLVGLGFRIVSTGGTLRVLQENGIDITIVIQELVIQIYYLEHMLQVNPTKDSTSKQEWLSLIQLT